MRALLAIMLALLATPASAERLVSMVSRDEVAITSSFAGETLSLVGNIEPETGSTQNFVEGPFHVIVVVTGPLQDRVARFKEPLLGIWMNTEQVVFRNFPSYYHVLASGSLASITSPEELARLGILPEAQARLAAAPGSREVDRFGAELIRLMTGKEFVGVNELGVVFRSDTFYSAQISLPSDVPPGPYLSHTYLFKSGQLVAERSEGFSVRKIGFERFLGQSSKDQPLLYGLVCVALALFTGWLGGVVFS